MTIAVPDEAQQAYIHDKYMNELVKGILRPETRERLLAIVGEMKARSDSRQGNRRAGAGVARRLEPSDPMALTATIYNFDIELADSDRNVYESLALRVARHPSESEEIWSRGCSPI